MKNLFDKNKTPFEQMSDSLDSYSDPCASFIPEGSHFFFGKERAGSMDNIGASHYDDDMDTSFQDGELNPDEDFTSPEDATLDYEGEVVPESESSAIEDTGDTIVIHKDELDPEKLVEIETVLELSPEEDLELSSEDSLENHEDLDMDNEHVRGVEPESQPDHIDFDAGGAYEGLKGTQEDKALFDLAYAILSESTIVPVKGMLRVNGREEPLVSKYQPVAGGPIYAKTTTGAIYQVNVGNLGIPFEAKATIFNPGLPQAIAPEFKDIVSAMNVVTANPTTGSSGPSNTDGIKKAGGGMSKDQLNAILSAQAAPQQEQPAQEQPAAPQATVTTQAAPQGLGVQGDGNGTRVHRQNVN